MKLRHAYVLVGNDWPKGVPWPWGGTNPLLHVEAEEEGTALHVWWLSADND